MVDKLKKLLYQLVDVLAVLVVMATIVVYIGSSGLLLASVINTLKLDTYIDAFTGVEISLLIFLLVWGPVVFIKRLPGRGRGPF